MKATCIAMLVLLLPAALLATSTMGIFFSPPPGGVMTNSPTAFMPFDAFVYGHNIQCYMDASEFKVAYPPGIVQIGFEIPLGSLNLGDPGSGISITYWPPMDGWNPGWNLLCTLHLLALDNCWNGSPPGSMADARLSIVPHPETGMDQGSCWPENYLFEFTGLTSIVCPEYFAVQAKTWGSIKSMF